MQVPLYEQSACLASKLGVRRIWGGAKRQQGQEYTEAKERAVGRGKKCPAPFCQLRDPLVTFHINRTVTWAGYNPLWIANGPRF